MKKELMIIGFLSIFIVAFSTTVISENPEKPSELNVSVSNPSPNVGDTVKIIISEIPYEGGGEMQFSADVYYGEKEDYILDHWIDPTEPNGWIYDLIEGVTYTTDFTFVPEKEGTVTIDVNCHRRYDVTSESIEINVLPNPDSESSTPGFEFVFVIIIISITLLIKKYKKEK